MGIGYQPVTPDDFDRTFKMKKSGLNLYFEQIWGWNEDDHLRLQRERFTHEGGRIVIFEGVEVGYLELFDRNSTLSLSNVVIVESCQSLGIGCYVVQSISRAKYMAERSDCRCAKSTNVRSAFTRR